LLDRGCGHASTAEVWSHSAQYSPRLAAQASRSCSQAGSSLQYTHTLEPRPLRTRFVLHVLVLRLARPAQAGARVGDLRPSSFLWRMSQQSYATARSVSNRSVSRAPQSLRKVRFPSLRNELLRLESGSSRTLLLTSGSAFELLVRIQLLPKLGDTDRRLTRQDRLSRPRLWLGRQATRESRQNSRGLRAGRRSVDCRGDRRVAVPTMTRGAHGLI
jgi:hypothetical protein